MRVWLKGGQCPKPKFLDFMLFLALKGFPYKEYREEKTSVETAQQNIILLYYKVLKIVDY
jgi:hypothetical protein